MIPLLWYGGKTKWDQDCIDWICPPDYFSTTESGDGAVVVIPAFDYLDSVSAINTFLNKLSWCVVVLTSDEASHFPWHQLTHPSMRIWIQSPRPDIHKEGFNLRYLPLGAPSFDRSALPLEPPDQSGVYFEGQLTHLRRDEMAAAFPSAIPTPGFTLGTPRDKYLARLASCQIAPCPSGPCTPETFRFWEALEMGAVPIVDTGPRQDELGRAVNNYPPGFWELLLGENTPFEVSNWSDAPKYADDIIQCYPVVNNETSAAYQFYKRRLRLQMLDDVGAVGGNYAGPPGSNTTVLVPTSPTPNNPSHSHLSSVYTAIRSQLPNSEILLLIDGVRPEQEHRRAAYNEYIRRILWLTNHHWTNVTPILFDQMEHQSGKVREALKHVRTDFILFNEHDTPMQGDIDWDLCIRELADDHLDLIRFYHEAAIHPEHEHLMLGNVHPNLVATEQWSGRPHIARTDYYRRIMDEHFSDASRTFIEWTLHGICQTEEWGRNRMALYAPSEGTMVRSGHLDARGGDPTFEDVTT